MTHLIRLTKSVLAGGLLALLVTGCSTLESVPKPFAKLKNVPKASRANPAVRIMGLWQPGEGDGIDGTVGRGFVGQIYFFTGQSESPVAVDGDVRVYVFDDIGTPEQQKKPIHQFDFKDGAWQGYQSESAIGPCYNIYVPYTRKGGLAAQCQLRMRLTRPDGSQLFSEMTEVELAGIARENSVMKRLRETPEYDLNPESQEEWRAQAHTIGIQKAGQLQRIAEEVQDSNAQDFVPQSPQRSRNDAPPLAPRTPRAKPKASSDREAEIQRLEQKLIELHRQRSQKPREMAPPQDARQLTPQAEFRQLSSSRHFPDAEGSSHQIQQLSFKPVPRREQPVQPALYQRLHYEQPQYEQHSSQPQYETYPPSRVSYPEQSGVSRADELRAILGAQ